MKFLYFLILKYHYYYYYFDLENKKIQLFIFSSKHLFFLITIKLYNIVPYSKNFNAFSLK